MINGVDGKRRAKAPGSGRSAAIIWARSAMTSAGSSPALPRPPLPPSRRVAVVVHEENQPPAWADPLIETVLHTLKTGAKDRLKRRRSDERNHASQNHRIRSNGSKSPIAKSEPSVD